jgi:hypothetical protein
MDGILVIDNDKDQLFDVFGRDNKNLVLRVNSTEAEKLEKYDLYQHFKQMEDKYADTKITSKTQLMSILKEYFSLTEKEVINYDIQLRYQGLADCKKTNNERSMFIFLMCVWLVLFIRWGVHNRGWFFQNCFFYAIRVSSFYTLKCLQCLILIVLLNW